jgi:hypothetical protein
MHLTHTLTTVYWGMLNKGNWNWFTLFVDRVLEVGEVAICTVKGCIKAILELSYRKSQDQSSWSKLR